MDTILLDCLSDICVNVVEKHGAIQVRNSSFVVGLIDKNLEFSNF